MICAYCGEEIKPDEPKVREFPEAPDGSEDAKAFLHLHCSIDIADGDAITAEGGW
jgi:hypothetical protein